MKTLLTTGWGLMRVIRLAMSIAGIAIGIANKDSLLGIAGGLFLLMAVFNVGCCGAAGCSVKIYNPKMKPSGKQPEKISNEEIV